MEMEQQLKVRVNYKSLTMNRKMEDAHIQTTIVKI